MGRTRAWHVSRVALAGLLFLACGPAEDDLSEPGRGVTASDAGLYAGSWRGVTGQGLALTFSVDEQGVTGLSLAWRLGSCDFATTLDFDSPAPIERGQFSRMVRMGPGQVEAEVSITFSTQTHAVGDLSFAVDGVPSSPDCAGLGLTTFTARKT